MSIVKMKKINLIGLRAQKNDLLRELMLIGCVEVSEPEDLLSHPEIASLTRRETSQLEQFRTDYAAVSRALDIIKRYAPVKTSPFARRQDVSVSRFLGETDLDKYLAMAEKLTDCDQRIRRLSAEETRKNSLIESLLPWEPMLLPLDSAGTTTSDLVYGAFPPLADLQEINSALADAAPEAQALEVSCDKDQLCALVVYLRDKQTAVFDILRARSFSESSLKNLHGTARENIEEAKEQIADMRSERDSLTEQIASEAPHRDDLQRVLDYLATKVARAEAAERLLATDSTLTLTGWVTAPSEKELGDALSKYTCAWELRDPVPEEYEHVPVQLKNNALTSPLTMVTEMYSLPAYDGVDPNPLMAPFFVLFYGIMMADVGYGLLMILAALIVKRKKPRGGMKNFFNLLLMCGVSTLALGVVTGSFFGDALPKLFELFGGTFTLPYKPLFDPLNNTQQVLIGALALGAFQIIVGMAISFVKQTRDGHFWDALFDVGSWWILFGGIALGAMGITWWVAIAGAAALVLTQGRSKPTVLGKLAGGVGSLYNITGYFGDILSYSRIMALMLAGGVIAQVFNTLAALTGNIVTFLLIFLVGHALNLGLNLLGCYVHDLRLQCLEFFGKFYKDGGRPFQPLRINTKYVNITDIDQ
jgi:V/A-type H+-transporting ATPase subunit I